MNRRLVVLSAVAALLAGYLVFEGLGPYEGQPVAVAPPPAGTSARSGTVKLNPLQGLDAQSFAAIVDRPLFNPSRLPRPAAPVVAEQPQPEQPPAEPPPPAPQGPGPGDYTLLGVASGPDGRIAALRIASSGEVVYLRKGESVENWSVIDVGDRSVEIGTPGNPVTYSMFAKTESAAPGSGDGVMPAQGQPQAQPLPLPLPVPQPQQPAGSPPLPAQHTVPPDTGG